MPETTGVSAPAPAAAQTGLANRAEGWRSRAGKRGFTATDAWIFDLDNTLYPANSNLFAAIDQRMAEFIAKLLGVSFAQARHLQKTYYRQFGTTLAGLMRVHKIAPAQFLDFVHDVDLDAIKPHPELACAIAALPGRKLIFTNGSRRHAERVAEKLGVLGLFEDICDIAACGYVPKPTAEAFDRMVHRHGVNAAAAAMFEDIAANLEVPHVLGMTTVLVHSAPPAAARAGGAHPKKTQVPAPASLPLHIHYLTDDLCRFLEALAPPPAPATEVPAA